MSKFLLLVGIGLLCSLGTYAQNRLVTGKILDDHGQAAAFASVQIKKTHKGVSADADGNFAIQAKPSDVLVISGTGLTTLELAVGDQSHLDITVVRKSVSLTEVVVTALGETTQKAKLGYATQTFSTSTINRNGVTGALDGLEGKVAGADISNTGGPGSSTKVVLRGYGVIAGGDNQPLFVIDGVPMSNADLEYGESDFGNGLNNVNPNDIESITILKGTAASSLYGGLAKNGAIMITTKRGRAGKLRVEYSGSADFSRVGKLPSYQSEFGQGWGSLFVSDENGSWGPKLNGTMQPWGAAVNGIQREKPFVFLPNNLRDFYVTGSEFNNNLSLSGGTDANRFYFSYGNVSSHGIIPGPENMQQRNTFSLRTNSNYGRFAINSSFNYINQDLTSPSTGQGSSSGGGVFESLLEIPVDVPITSFKDYNNPYNNISNFFSPYLENPYFGLYQNGDQQKLDRFFGNVDLSFKFTNDLSAEYRLGGDITNARTSIWKQIASPLPNTWDGTPSTNPEGQGRTPDIGEVFQGSDYVGIINQDLIVKFNKGLGSNFHLDALAGGNAYQSQGRTETAAITNLLVPSFFNLSNSTSPPTALDNSSELRRVGLYGQATIGFKDQVYLTGNIRNDWSSTLPIDHNSIFYPGANISWVASQLLGSNSVVSFLKFRAAYGRTGSDPAPYQVLASLGPGSIGLPFGGFNSPFNGIAGYGLNNTIGNLDLKPIFTNEAEVGAEARFLRDRIGMDVSLYNKNTNGQIFAVPIAPSTGYSNLVENLGLVNNKGIELTLNATAIQSRHFTWNVTYVFSRNWNRVINLTGATQNPLLTSAYAVQLRAVVGKSVASIYSPVAATAPNGQIVVNAATGYPAENQAPLDRFGNTEGYIGTGLYTYQMGLTNTLRYRDFSLTASLDFRYGGVMYSETADMALFVGNGIATTYNGRKPFVVPNSVVAAGTDASGKTIYAPNTSFVGNTIGGGENDDTYGYYYPTENSGTASQMRIIDRSFLKLRDVNLSYSLPTAWASRIKANTASLGIYGRNFLLWTPKSNVYVDPEATNLGNDLQSQLGEFATAPLTKSVGVILKIVF